MMKNAYNYTHAGVALTRMAARCILLLLLLAATQGLRAQNWFTLTNGHYYWFDGRESDPDDSKYLTGFDHANGSAPIRTRGTHATASVTEIVEQGDTYLALDLSNPSTPRIVNISTDGGFTPYCVWYRTGNTGSYYQEWDGYRYYLVASHSEGLRIYKVAAGAPLMVETQWYNWDHGAAISEEVQVPGGTSENYYWLMYDNLNDADGTPAAVPEWRMSTVSSYQRPEEMIYRNYRADGAGGNTWDNASDPDRGITYYDNVRVGGQLNYPAGLGATFMAVGKTEHPMVISGLVSGHGLNSVAAAEASIGYGESVGLTADVITTTSNDIHALVTDAYTEYNEETYRRGVNLNSHARTENIFGSAGIPTVHNWYYYGDANNDGITDRHTTPPTEYAATLGIVSVVFSIDERSRRYLSVSSAANGDIIPGAPTASNNTHHWHSTLTCNDLPQNPTTATITVTVTYSNGTTQTLSTTILVTPSDLSEDVKSTRAPVIKGYVVGGGRMANVEGSTSVIVHNADSIYAIYGGNDIAGWVQGDGGATIQVGTRYTNADHPIHIDNLYGGGCGFYRYSGAYDAATGTWADNGTKTTDVDYGQYAFRGGVYDWYDPTIEVVAPGTFDYDPYTGPDFAEMEDGNRFVGTKLGGTIPYVKTSHVSIGVPEETGHTDAMGHNAHEHNDNIFIDSLFGGAENAFIGITSNGDKATAITVDINGGTILTAFGGNNYGGAIANYSLTYVNVNCTKLEDDRAEIANSYFHGYGRDFGIRHLFGGGNKVDATHAEVTFSGGMVDTAFVGGNSATVHHPVGIVDCRRDENDITYNTDGEEAVDGYMNGHFIYTNTSITSSADTANNGLLWENYDADNGIWNVHYLFAGNNLAPMENVSFITLKSGGVGSVYGGGNQGDMNNNMTLQQSAVYHNGFIDLPPLLAVMSGILAQSTLITVPPKIGAVIAAMDDSQIIVDYVYGGCRNANVKNTCGVFVAGGDYGDIIAGNDVSGDVGSETDGATYLVVTGNTVVQGSIYGGCDGYYHCDRGDGHYSDQQIPNPFSSSAGNDPYNDFAGLLMPTVQHTNVFVNGGLIKGDVVAGGLLADVGFPNSSARTPRIKHSGEPEEAMSAQTLHGTVRLEIAGTAEIRGNVFGGGANASIWGLSQVYVKETPIILGSLFAGNDCVGRVESFLPYQSVVDYTGCANARDSLQAESLNQAAQLSSNGDSLNFYTTTVDGIKQYDPKYSTYLLIEGSPIINSVYGSGNGAWNYDNDPNSPFPWVYVCPGQEGSRPDQASTFIDIHTAGGYIDTVFGGGAGCSVSDKVTVLLNTQTVNNPAYPDSIHSTVGSLARFSHFVGGTSRTDDLADGTPAAGSNFVGTIFGGNNFSDMNVVPNIMLVQGNVKNVYGGGNKGNMTKKETVYDICVNEVPDISTHILSESPNVTVTDSVFGGCRMSDLEGMAYVEVRQTSENGIQYLYGGNDISGNVNGNTRIDMSAGTVHRIWGGSNGRYEYVPMGEELYNVYRFGDYDSSDPSEGLIATAAKPDVDSTNVNLWGGTINSSVFTGGSLADCRATCLIVNDRIGCSVTKTINGSDVTFSTGNMTVSGALYGGGEGRWDDLNARDNEGNRWGNVTGATHVHLYHAKNVTEAIAYGGGGGGDVGNTNIIAHEEWNSPFIAIYGGCWGSDVSGIAYIEFNGDTLVNNLYGGNDFTGNVYRTEMLVNSGNFYNVYGGGNGDYPDSYYHSQHANALLPQFAYQNADPNAYAGGDSVERPNTEYIHIVFNGGEVDSCLYGGGKRGTVLPYQKNSNGEYIVNSTRLTNDGVIRYIPDTVRTKAQTVSDPDDFAYIVLNVHGGKFHRNVFAGGRGYKKDKRPIVYGLKVVNMDGGEIYESLYGGSEFINDGYPAECKAPAAANPTFAQQMAVTTRRPSSIVNFTGGTVGGNFYGTGYQGLVYGSSYVNIGIDAIDSCTVWRNSYGTDSEDSTYIMFKPGQAGGQSDALVTNTLTLRNSVYSGANWGNASGAVTFDNPGFVGGESRMYIDGNRYNTTNDLVSTNPEMVIMRSLFGSGTSVLGGDLHSHIEVRNYGGMETCHPTKRLETIQRTDSLWLHNTAIIFTGTTDASQQYMSNRYSIMNVRQMNYRGYNVSELQAAADNVENLGFFEQGTTSAVHTDVHFDTVEVPLAHLNTQIDQSACGDDVDICSKEYMVSPDVPAKRHTLIILDNGVNLIIGNGTEYGEVTGYGFVTTPGGYQSRIMAQPKLKLASGSDSQYNSDDGGFVASCQDSNKTRALSDDIGNINLAWATGGSFDELPYTNHAHTDASGFKTDYTRYREWKVGDKMGLREVEATLLAHSNPVNLDRDWSLQITCGGAGGTALQNLSIAEAIFEMPATAAGHYYMLTGEGFTMTGSNGEIELVDSAWHPSLNASLTAGGNLDMSTAMSDINNWYTTGHLSADANGEWINIPNGNANEMVGTDQIRQVPNYTFGLVMTPNANFATSGATTFDMPSSIDHDDNSTTPNVTPLQDWAYFVINGNARVNSVNNYCSPKVYDNEDSENPEIKPSMRLYLTYDTSFTNTFNGSVTFQMMEYDAAGNKVAPILVKINIQTIIDELKDMDQDVLAMYNGGRTNTFTRKVELVPCGEERNLYITGIRWMPTNKNGEDTTAAVTSSAFGNGDRFSLLGDTAAVQAVTSSYPHAVSVGHPGDNNHSSHNRFAMTIIPSNNVSEDAGMANGWIRGTDVRTNLYKLVYPSGTDPVKTLEWDGVGDSVAIHSLQSTNGNDAHGYFLGTLDGRGSAMLDVELTFDGTRVYDDMDGKGYVGKVILTMETFTEEDDISRGTFEVTIYVKTRAHGDTIYIASANSVTRCVASNKCLTVYPYSDVAHNGTSFQKNEIGKTPGLYVQSFRKALEDGIYEEGDVLCIMDTVIIDNTPVHITGPNGPPIEVIRYDGHHHQLPDEQSVYRGPMIVVRNEGSFTADNISFHGGAGAHVTHIKRSDGAGDYDGSHDADLDGSGNLQYWNYTYSGKTIDKIPDTNRVYGPIIQAIGDGTMVNLREGTVVQHNWNEYGSQSGQTDGNGMPTSSANMGAISVTDGATLTLGGNVTVENNFSHPIAGHDDLADDSVSIQKAPGGAAIYVDGGTVELVESNRNTAVTITNNYLMNPLIYTDPTAVTWWDLVENDGVPERYTIDTSDLRHWDRANLLLTREGPATGTYFELMTEDTQSDIIVVSGIVGDETKIGVRKWFPGIHERDTIRFVVVEGGNNSILASAVNDNENFISDEGFRTFYNPLVNLTTGYFFRCATFRHQLASDDYVGPVHDRYPALTLASGDVLHFGARNNMCPTGGDSIIYRVQGGMMPYTYTWTDPIKEMTLQTTVSPYSDAQVQYDLAGGENGTTITGTDRYAKYAASMADTLLLPAEEINSKDNTRVWNHLRVTAVDATGECVLYKDIDVRIVMDHNTTDPITYWPKASAIADTSSHTDNSSPWRNDTVGTGWTDTSRTVHAVASRNFSGVHITPRVWVDRSQGTISATVVGDDNDYIYQFVDNETSHELTNLNFCPGDTIYLYTEPRGASSSFIMWDFDPYYRPLALYTVPAHNDTVTAYYGPNDYWHEVINNTTVADAVYDDNFIYTDNGGHSFVNTYNGDVHIYDEKGLAWLISRVNGFNGQQSRSFHFNRVLIHAKSNGDPYDMKDHLWYPLGTEQHPFMGRLFGVSSDAAADLPWSNIDGTDTTFYTPVVIKNIIVNEPEMFSAGIFGYLDSAGIYNIDIQGEMVRGSQYVGGVAGISSNSYVRRTYVRSDIEDNALSTGFTSGQIPTTILTTHYVSGGMLGKSTQDTVTASNVAVKFVGDAVYGGGGIGYGRGSIIYNVTGHNYNRQEGLYLGGIAGYLNDTMPYNAYPTSFFGRLFGKGKATTAIPSQVLNNYFRITNEGFTQRLGGVVGYAENTIIENNYVYGDLNAMNVGGVTALAGSGTKANHNYYASESASRATYRTQGDADMGHTSDFDGQGNQVLISEPAYGTNNLTRALNLWVREHNAQGGNFFTWRSDLEGNNFGYPIFGRPDMIPVSSTTTVDGCSEVEYDGITYYEDATLQFVIIDSIEMIDSTATIHIRVHNAVHTVLNDSTESYAGYQGYGFTVTPTETMLLGETMRIGSTAQLVLTDTLQTAFGCDSIVTLMLVVTSAANDIEDIEVTEADIKVYPNPTTDMVTVETSEMSRVEIYDNEGRRLEDYTVNGDIYRLSMGHLASGVYYLRVHTPRGVTIQKVVKK